jgi:hypothetical protein
MMTAGAGATCVSGGHAMGFRRDGKAAKGWRDWRQKHAATLAKCGLPEVVYRDPVAWENFLVEGFLPPGSDVWSGWKVEMLSPQQARDLYAFLDREVADHPFRQMMMNHLRRLFNPGAGA